MGAWEALDRASEDATWDRLESSFGFRPSTTAFPVVTEPSESVTYDVSGAYGDEGRYQALTLDLCERLVEAMRRCGAVREIRSMYVGAPPPRLRAGAGV